MYLLMRNKMIRVSAPIHGGSPVFKHDSIGLSTSIGKKGGYQKGYQNGYQKNLLIQKELYRCNGFPVVDDQITTKTNSSPYKKSQSNGAPFRTPNAQKNRFSPNPKSANISQRSLPSFNKDTMQFNQFNQLSKLDFGDQFSEQQQGGNVEPILFAGSKSCVTPSPSELPKPPRNWTTTNRKLQPSEMVVAKAAAPLAHDSAVLLSIK